ncbi:MAG: MarR family transcriptional regulator [Terriglobales bacterium]
MRVRKPVERPPGPPPAIMQKIRQHLSEPELQGLRTVFTLRATAQHVDNAISEWMAGSVGSVARYQILMALWASKGKGISHKHIVAAMGVTRATVSGLMAALERDGLVKSQVDGEDRRKLIARLTAKGEAVIKKQHELNLVKFRVVFSSFTSEELSSLAALLHRFREAFAAPADP